MAIYIDRQGGLAFSRENFITLKHFRYDPILDRLVADRPIETTLSSLYVGEEKFRISSGSDQLFTTDLNLDIDWYYLKGGLKDHRNVSMHDRSGVIQPSARVYAGDVIFTTATGQGEAFPYIWVDSTGDFTLGVNASVFSNVIRFRDPVPIGTKLVYEIYLELDGSGPRVYRQEHRTTQVYDQNSPFTWYFDNPVEGLQGTEGWTIVYIDNEDGTTTMPYLSARDDGLRKYVPFHFRPFEDLEIAYKRDLYQVVPLTSDATGPLAYSLLENITMAVDATLNPVNITLDESHGITYFTVFDGNQTFNPTSPCTIDFGAQGIVTLQSKKDNFTFYKDGTIWKFLDNSSKEGGTV